MQKSAEGMRSALQNSAVTVVVSGGGVVMDYIISENIKQSIEGYTNCLIYSSLRYIWSAKWRLVGSTLVHRYILSCFGRHTFPEKNFSLLLL
ncbi:hypothetical protein C5167_046009, partial [Papaver somniferum]